MTDWNKHFGPEAMVKRALTIMPDLRKSMYENQYGMDASDKPQTIRDLWKVAYSCARDERRQELTIPPVMPSEFRNL